MKWITIFETLNLSEMTLIRQALENEGIEVNLLNEKTLQLSSVYALGNHGAEVQVREKDVEKAVLILTQSGFVLPHQEGKTNQFSLLNKLVNFTDSIPFLKDVQREIRMVFALFLLLVLVISIILLFMFLVK